MILFSVWLLLSLIVYSITHPFENNAFIGEHGGQNLSTMPVL